jgi:2-methylisocitrate lyase-like PEP mutase family enzyme
MTTPFAALHDGAQPLVLPNAWDVPSALALLGAGFGALGTTSFGVAASHGTPDGGRSTRELNVALADALRPLGCLVSVDIEDGYSDDPDTVAEYVAALPCAGINLEDSTAERLVDPEVHAAKVRAVKARCPEVFVNARVDTYWLTQDADVAPTLARARSYVAAGADGVFVPGATEPNVIRALAEAIDRPLNVLPVPGLSVTELGALGVRRVSTGSLPYRAAIQGAIDAAVSVRDGATPPAAIPYADLQRNLVRYACG